MTFTISDDAGEEDGGGPAAPAAAVPESTVNSSSVNNNNIWQGRGTPSIHILMAYQRKMSLS